METVNNLDWAKKVITELADIAIQDDAICNFVMAYGDGAGDNTTAWEEYRDNAWEIIMLADGQDCLLVFPDGSGYADWHQGSNCFFPDATKALTKDEWEKQCN